MTDRPSQPASAPDAKAQKQAALAKALRANLKRRKQAAVPLKKDPA